MFTVARAGWLSSLGHVRNTVRQEMISRQLGNTYRCHRYGFWNSIASVSLPGGHLRMFDASVSCQRAPMTCATERASRFADRAVFLAASRAPVFIVTLAPVHATDRARFDRATLHASSPAVFQANDLIPTVQFYPSQGRFNMHECRDPKA